VDLERVELVVTEPGDRARTIVDNVDGQEPTALCLATHARRGVSEVVHHHVAQHVLRGVHSPAWVVGRECSRHPRTGPIVVFHDGSEAANAVVGPTRAWARCLGVPTRLVHVVDALDRDAGPTPAVTWALEQLGLNGDPVPVRRAFPIEAITEFARTVGACAIAVARPPADDHDRAIGHLPSGLIRESSCPVLVAPGAAR
jgi:nucleotide-binding universal stress UspA family protein